MKNVIICFDGTGNQYGKNNSNVVHTAELLEHNNSQVVCYDPGVGTFDPLMPKDVDTFSGQLGELAGNAFGAGLKTNIMDGYKYLMRHYKMGDNVYLFGFSRGAFIARALTGILHKAGLIEDGCYNLLPYLWNLYEQGDEELIQGFKHAFCRPCPVHFVGVWDTVASVGYFIGKDLKSTSLEAGTTHAYHALSIDEQRKKFQPVLWQNTSHEKQTVEQVWFAGAHSDVGGSYPERGLSDITLQWMLSKAEACGAILSDQWQSKLHGNPEGVLHHSRKGLWRVWRPSPRVLLPGSMVHVSVRERMAAIPDYRPANLPDDVQFTDG